MILSPCCNMILSPCCKNILYLVAQLDEVGKLVSLHLSPGQLELLNTKESVCVLLCEHRCVS